MSETKGSVQIKFKGLSREDIDSLHDFLKANKSVTHVYPRIYAMDAAYDPSLSPKAAVIVGLAIGIARLIGAKAVDVAADLVREWLKNRKTENPNVEVILLWGPDNKPVVKVKKSELK
jgi:hypothetical protein